MEKIAKDQALLAVRDYIRAKKAETETEVNAKILSYAATMDILTSVVLPEGTQISDHTATFSEGVTVTNHTINL